MFTVAQFFEKQQLRVLAVPVSWVRDGCLLWPKLPSNEKIEKLRNGGCEFHGATKRIPVIVSRKYKSLHSAEAAAEDLLKQEVSDIETKRKLLKHRKSKPEESRPLKDYNKIISEIASSKKPALDSDIAIQQQEHPGTIAASSQLVQLPPQDYSSVPTYIQPRELGHQTQRPPINSLSVKTDRAQLAANFVETVQALGTQSVTQSEVGYLPQVIFKKPVDQSKRAKSSDIARPRQIQRNEEPFHRDEAAHAVLKLPDGEQQFQSVYVTDDNIVYLNPTLNNPDSIDSSGNIMDSIGEIKIAMESLKSAITNVGTTVNTLRAEVSEMRNDMTRFKDGIKETVRQVVEDCLEKSFPRFATMLDMDSKGHSTSEHSSVEEHKLINDEKDLFVFNKTLSSKQVFDDYVKYFTKIIPPITYYAKGDSACYLLVDCLFTREFWNSFTWTGINRGNKSKRGFREFANVLQLLLAIVSVGDPTYTNMKLEAFCKNRLFRYSKTRSSSKQLRKSTCRRTKTKKDDANENHDEAEQVNYGSYDDGPDNGESFDDDELGDTPMDNITSGSNQDDSDDEVDRDIDVKSHVEVLMNSDDE
ncbi:uncharacterized protein LOC110677188 [Aedes aegypti]|uniref:DUF4806 domain-containing protein n=1 Tax=Aedes aegypti TaxID=7159 RepID=A0A6I8U3T1_AEDAE|nr:uncharacterized protein LOC110677188 [Aedes aegypti]